MIIGQGIIEPLNADFRKRDIAFKYNAICDHLRFNKFIFIEYTNFESVLITYRIYKREN